MSAFLDTSVVVRNLTGRPPDMADRARRLLASGETLTITDTILVETGFVLTRTYGIARQPAVDAMIGLLRNRHIATAPMGKELAIQALRLCRDSGRVSFADAMLWASARFFEQRVHTFDRRFPEEGVEVVEPR